MRLNGRYGQVTGPFEVGSDLLMPGGAIDIAALESNHPVLSTVGIIAAPGTRVQINDAIAKISPFGVLEISELVDIKKLIFLDATDEDTIIDFVY